MIKYIFTMLFAIIYSTAVLAMESEFYYENKGNCIRVGLSYIKGAPNPICAHQKYFTELHPTTYTPKKIEDYLKKDISEGSLAGAVVRYGYGWMFIDIPNDRALKYDLGRIPQLIKDRNHEFFNPIHVVGKDLYLEARNKVKNIIETDKYYNYNKHDSVYIDRVVDVPDDEIINFQRDLFYAYGGELEKGSLVLPLWRGALERKLGNGNYKDVYTPERAIKIDFLDSGYAKGRISAWSLNDRIYDIYAARTPEGKLHIQGLETAF